MQRRKVSEGLPEFRRGVRNGGDCFGGHGFFLGYGKRYKIRWQQWLPNSVNILKPIANGKLLWYEKQISIKV